MRLKSLSVGLIFALLAGCASANYAFWNKLGYEKRDILVSRVESAKTEQEKAKEQFKTTLQRFQELLKGSHDGTMLSFCDRASGQSSVLALMSYDAVAQKFSNYQVLATPQPGRHLSWPAFTPDNICSTRDKCCT